MASSARTEQWILTGGRFSSCTMSVFLILPASWIVFPFSHSVERLELAMADPQPKVLNFASTIVPSSTLICSFMTSPHSGAPTIPVPTPCSSFLKLPMLRGLLKWSTTFSLYAMSQASFNLNRGSKKLSRSWMLSGLCRSDRRRRLLHELFVPIPSPQIFLGLIADIFPEFVPVILDGLGVFHDLVFWP